LISFCHFRCRRHSTERVPIHRQEMDADQPIFSFSKGKEEGILEKP
jgi:hypothetical protein